MNTFYMDNYILTEEDIDILYFFIDLDNSGTLEFEEFMRKLKRSGVFIKKKDEELIDNLQSKIADLGYDVERLFEIIDKDGNK